MPVSYYSSTGPLSFEPVPLRDQAVGPIEVAAFPSPPDEIIDPGRHGKFRISPYFGTVLPIAAVTAFSLLALAGAHS